MALKQTVKLDNGIIVTDGYWKLGTMIGMNKEKDSNQVIKADVLLYKDMEARNNGLPVIITIKIEFYYDLSKVENIFEQGYSFLLRQEKFKNAVSC